MTELAKSSCPAVKRWRIVALLSAIAVAATACGGDGEDTSSGDGTTEESVADTTDEAAADNTDGAEAEAEAEAGGLPVELGEWYVALGDVTAGPNTFAITNAGENPHALAIAKGTAYEDLPLKDNGAVDTDALGADFLSGTDNVPSGESSTLDIELEAGDYVFFCPIEFGPNSHASNGQVLSVTVG